MCGIAGAFSVRPEPELGGQLRRMTDAAAHRGPDDAGRVVFDPDGRVRRLAAAETGAGAYWTGGLGHRRLSILDLSAQGHQPMSDEMGRYWLVFNGEIYNYLELRDELAAAGYRFRSRTDSEVILQAYLRWGADCVARFNGMWAFAIYDAVAGTLFCARDRFGIKPFYYVQEPGRFAFASEIKQLLTLPWVRRELNVARGADFFLWGFETHTDDTFFRGIHSLPAAHVLEWSQEDLLRGRCKLRRYWSPVPAARLAEREAIGQFRDLLADSVRLRLRSDVPVGVTLSGGLDSASVTCLAGEQRRRDGANTPFDAFNVEFAGAGYSERGFAESAAARAGGRLLILRPDPGDLARDWERFLWHMEEPFGGLSYFSNYQIYRLIRERGIPVVLTGQGGDEILLGYKRYRTYEALFQFRSGHLGAALGEIWAARRHAGLSLSEQLQSGLYFSLPYLRAVRRRNLVQPILRRDFFREQGGQDDQLRLSMRLRDRADLQTSEIFRFQLPHLLRHEDRVSMAHSVESRLPFLDYRLLELVMGQPTRLLFREGWSKYLLREAMAGILPQEIQRRTDKMGYETPTGRWMAANRRMFDDLFARHRDDPVVDAAGAARLFDQPGADARLLCAAASYLGWKETFGVA